MGKVYGRRMYISAGGTDISTYCNTSTFDREAEVDQVTGYGVDDHVYDADGIRDGTFEIGGVYDDTAVTSPNVLFDGNEGDSFAIVRRVQGTGVGKPQQAFTAILKKYVETAPVAGHTTWSATFQKTGSVVKTTQA